MNFKAHFLYSHYDYFPESIWTYCEEQEKRVHQDVSDIERIYQGRWEVNVLDDYCWKLLRWKKEDGKQNRVRRRSKRRRSFNQMSKHVVLNISWRKSFFLLLLFSVARKLYILDYNKVWISFHHCCAFLMETPYVSKKTIHAGRNWRLILDSAH